MPNLYELSSEFAAALAVIEDENGELSPETIATLDALQMSVDAKVGNCMKFILSIEAEADGIDAHAKRLQEMVAARRSKAKRLRQYVMDCMDLSGLVKVATDIGTVAKQRNGTPSVDLKDGCKVPPNFIKQVPVELDKKKATELWRKEQEQFKEWSEARKGQNIEPEVWAGLVEEWRRSFALVPPEITVTVGSHIRIR